MLPRTESAPAHIRPEQTIVSQVGANPQAERGSQRVAATLTDRIFNRAGYLYAIGQGAVGFYMGDRDMIIAAGVIGLVSLMFNKPSS